MKKMLRLSLFAGVAVLALCSASIAEDIAPFPGTPTYKEGLARKSSPSNIHEESDTDTYFACDATDSPTASYVNVAVNKERILIHVRDISSSGHAFPFVKWYDEHWEYDGDVIFWLDGLLFYGDEYSCKPFPQHMQPKNGGHFEEDWINGKDLDLPSAPPPPEPQPRYR